MLKTKTDDLFTEKKDKIEDERNMIKINNTICYDYFPQTQSLVTVNPSKKAILWNVKTRKAIGSIALQFRVASVKFSPDGVKVMYLSE